MLNPFLLGPNRKLGKASRTTDEEYIARYYGKFTGRAATRNPLTLRLGRLLIRIGTELSREGPM